MALKVGLHYPMYFQLLEVLLQKLVDLKFTLSLHLEILLLHLELIQYNILWSLVVVAHQVVLVGLELVVEQVLEDIDVACQEKILVVVRLLKVRL
jgi:hypothetical protein